MKKKEQNSKFNASGCKDPTAYQAVKHISCIESEQEKRLNSLIKIIKYVVQLSGFKLVGRIVLKDVKTGKEYR